MTVICEACGTTYDDTYRLTFCPHEAFEMRAVASRGDQVKVCTTVEELLEFMR
jgi:hypothetical protein